MIAYKPITKIDFFSFLGLILFQLHSHDSIANDFCFRFNYSFWEFMWLMNRPTIWMSDFV